MQGATVKDVEPAVFITALAEHFKKSGKLELPEWHDLVKTATYKEMCPQDPDWYFTRAASVARRIYLRGGIGVGAFTKIYGGRYRNGTNKRHFAKAAKGVNRHILQALANMDIVAVQEEKKGRYITTNGRRELDTVAAQIIVARNGDDDDEDEDEAE